MNQIFCFKRYAWLLKRQWFENAVNYKRGIALIVIIIGMVYVWVMHWNVSKHPLDRMPIVFGVVMIFLSLYTFVFFDSLNVKSKGMFYFSLPVSPLERVATAFVFTMVLFPVFLFAVFNIFDFLFVLLYNYIHGTSEQMIIKLPLLFTMQNILGWMSICSISLLCSLIYGKNGHNVGSFLFVFIFIFSLNVLKIKLFAMLDFFAFLLPIVWITMYFFMKKRET